MSPRHHLRLVLALGLVLLAIPLQQSIGGNSQTSAVDLSSAKVVSLYESILDTDGQTLTRILADTGTEVVFRAYFQVAGPGGMNTQDLIVLRDTIAYVKARMPWVHFMGGVDAYGYCGWSLPANASEFLYVVGNGNMPKEAPNCWDLDIAKPAARKIVLDMAYAQIDAGFDSLFIDCVDCLADTFNLNKAPYMDAWKMMMPAMKDYARVKYGKDIWITMNNGWMYEGKSAPWPYQDFLAISVSVETMKTQSVQDHWNSYKAQVIQTYGHLIPIMVFFDWGCYCDTPLSVFGNLPKESQTKVLRMLQDEATKQGLLLVYPLHGGDIMTYAQIEQGQPWRAYDAIEQGTYDAIKQLTSTISTVHTMTVTATSTETLTATVTANKTVTAPAPPLVENPVLLIPVLVLGIAIVLAAIIMTRRKSSSCK